MPAALELRVDDPAGLCHPRETITGQVRVWVVGEARCEAVRVYLRAAIIPATGEARSIDDVNAVDLMLPELKPGTYDLPFEIEAPSGPLSHDGKLFRIKWKLVARGTGSDQKNLRTSVPIQLEADPAGRWSVVEGEQVDLQRSRGGRGFAALGILVSCALLACGVAGLAFRDLLLARAGFTLGGLATLFALVRVASSSRATHGQFVVTHEERRDGGVLHCTLLLDPRERIAAADAELVVFERIGDAKQPEEEVLSAHPIDLEPADAGEYRGMLPLPRTAGLPGTWKNGNLSLGWALRAKTTGRNGLEHLLRELPLEAVAAPPGSIHSPTGIRR